MTLGELFRLAMEHGCGDDTPVVVFVSLANLYGEVADEPEVAVRGGSLVLSVDINAEAC